MNRILIVFLATAFLISCNGEKKEASATSKPEIKMYRLDGGTIMVNNLEIFSQGDLYKGKTKQFANSYFIIDHPKGKLVWDTGLPNNLVGKEPFTSPDGNFTVSRQATAGSQLKAIGLNPADINYLALSHTHFDHTGAATVFKNATWLVQEKEYTYVKSEETQENNPDQYEAVRKISKIQILNGDHDVFGDGTVVIKSMPGHTPGHSALYVDLPSGAVLLSGDLYHFNENRDGKVVPQFNTSVKETKASMEAFEAFAKAKNATVILQHELQDFSQTIAGEFIYLADAAVLKGDNFIYGVKIDDATRKLAAQVKGKQRDEYDMVPVLINGVINPKPEGAEGWDKIVTIKEIIEVKEPTSEGTVKVENTIPLN